MTARDAHGPLFKIFDLKTLSRAGDLNNVRGEWKRWSFVFIGYCGSSSSRALMLMTSAVGLTGVERPGARPPAPLHSGLRAQGGRDGTGCGLERWGQLCQLH